MKKILFPLLMAVLLFSCNIDTNRVQRLVVTGNVVTRTISLDSFNEVVIAGPVNIVLDQNGGSSADIETYESLMDIFNVEVFDDVLILYLQDTSSNTHFNIETDFNNISSNAILSGSRIKWPNNEKVLNVHLSISDINKIQVIGECEIKTAQTLTGKELNFEVAGALSFDADLILEDFNAEIAGAASLKLRGSSANFNLECAGAGTIEAYEFISDNVTIEIAGVCNAEVYSRESINVEIAGLGTVKYKGDAHTVNFDKAGFGKIKKIESEDIEL